jgi:hypothetical protein
MPQQHRRSGGLSLAIVLVMVVGSACSSSATPAPAASVAPATAVAPAASIAPSTAPSVAGTASVAPSAAPAGGGSAARWCAFVIEINTKYGFMKDKTYSATLPTSDVWRQIVNEALSRVDEWRAVTPPEIMDATNIEIAWFQAFKAYGDANGWPSDFSKYPSVTPAQVQVFTTLTPYQTKECGIKFGT